MFVTFIGCSSCATSITLFGPGDLFRDKRRSFIKIDIYKNIKVAKTSSSASEPPAEEYEIDLRSAASGFIVGHDRDITLVTTSAHVCSVLYNNQINFFIPDYSPWDSAWTMKEKAMYVLNDYRGKNRLAFPLVFDFDSDICILATKKMILPALDIAKRPPIIGETYYNIAAPMGLWTKGMIPLFKGFYLGAMKIRSDRKNSYAFSIPTKGGSSGSPILNSYGEVVGAIHSAYRGFENLCMATTNTQIYLIYRKAMQKLLRNYEQYHLITEMMNI